MGEKEDNEWEGKRGNEWVKKETFSDAEKATREGWEGASDARKEGEMLTKTGDLYAHKKGVPSVPKTAAVRGGRNTP